MDKKDRQHDSELKAIQTVSLFLKKATHESRTRFIEYIIGRFFPEFELKRKG